MTDRLRGQTVLVTRPVQQSAELVGALRSHGAQVEALPAIDIEPRSKNDIARQTATLAEHDVVIFVSRNAARYGADILEGNPARVAAIGPATAATLEELGARNVLRPTAGFDSDALLAHESLAAVTGKRVLIVRGQTGRPRLGDVLAARGATVDYVAVYDRRQATHDRQSVSRVAGQLAAGRIDFTVVMSVATLDALRAILGDDGLLAHTVLVSPAERVIQTARSALPSIQCVLADDPGADGIVDAIGAFVAAT